VPSILVAVEPAFVSAGTLTASAALAQALGLSLVLARLPSEGRSDRPDAPGDLEAALQKVKDLGVRVQACPLQGEAETGLLGCVQEHQARLVVFAEDPQSTRIESLTGAIIRNLSTALLLVRDPEPLKRWALGEAALRTMLAMDFSACSQAALSWVQGLHSRLPVNLELLHVSWLPGQRRRLGMLNPREPHSEEAEEAEIRQVLLREMAEFSGMPPGVRCSVGLSLGRTADAIAFAAAERASDLVVVGTRQRQGLSRLWHGSVAGGVLAEVRSNVAVVPLASESVSQVGPVRLVRSVLAATDFSENGDRTVQAACSLLPDGGTVHLVHVVDPHLPEAAQSQLRSRLAALEVPTARAAGVRLEVEVLSSRTPAEAICARAERLGVDVVCVGYRGRTALGWGSVSDAVLKRSDRPVLVVKNPISSR